MAEQAGDEEEEEDEDLDELLAAAIREGIVRMQHEFQQQQNSLEEQSRLLAEKAQAAELLERENRSLKRKLDEHEADHVRCAVCSEWRNPSEFPATECCLKSSACVQCHRGWIDGKLQDSVLFPDCIFSCGRTVSRALVQRIGAYPAILAAHQRRRHLVGGGGGGAPPPPPPHPPPGAAAPGPCQMLLCFCLGFVCWFSVSCICLDLMHLSRSHAFVSVSCICLGRLASDVWSSRV